MTFETLSPLLFFTGTVAKVVGFPGFIDTRPKWIVPPRDRSIVGQFPVPGGDRWGALLAKGSPLTACVSQAVNKLRSSGDLKSIETQWMGKAAGAPELTQ